MDIWLPLLSGFVGAVIGAAASIITVIVQARHETKRHRSRILSDLALKEHENALQYASRAGIRASIQPPIVYMHYYARVLDLLEQGLLDEQSYDEVYQANQKFIELVEEHTKDKNKMKNASGTRGLDAPDQED